MRAFVLLALGLVQLVAAAAAQSPQEQSPHNLLDIYQLALRQDAQFRAAQAQFQAAKEAYPQALSGLLPQVSASAGYRETELDVTSETGIQANGAVDFPTKTYALNLNQVVFDWAQFLQPGQAEASVAQARAQRDAAMQELVLRVSQAYFDVLAAQDELAFTRAEKDAIGRQLDQAKKRFDVGVIPITGVKEAQANFDRSDAAVIQAENQVDVAREALKVLTGQTLEGGLSRLSGEIPLVKPEPSDIDAWVNTAVEQNLQLVAARFASRVAAREVRIRRSGHFPTVGFTATLSNEDAAGSIFGGGSETETQAIGVELNLPIFSGGFVSSRTSEARATFRQNQALEEQQRREAIRQTRGAYLTVIAGISRVQALKQAVASNQAAYEAVQAGFDVGTRTSVDVLLALRDTFSAKRDLARARYDYLIDTMRLQQAAGILAPADLQEINRLL